MKIAEQGYFKLTDKVDTILSSRNKWCYEYNVFHCLTSRPVLARAFTDTCFKDVRAKIF